MNGGHGLGNHSHCALRLAAAILLGLSVGVADAATYQVDRTHSSVDFSIRHLVGRTKGRFAEFSGTIVYDPSAPAASTFSGAVQVSSIDTGNERRDEHLKSPDFFDAQTYPTITFESTKVTKTGDHTLDVAGRLTMHGVTRQIVLAVEVLGTAKHPTRGTAQAGFAATLTVRCSDYGVNRWERFNAVLGNEVKVDIAVEANAG